MVPSLVNHHDMVYCIGGRSGGALAVRAGGQGDVTGSRRVWTSKKGSNVSSPVFYQEHLYWAHEQLGIINCVQADTGELLYEERLPRAGQIYASPVLAGGNLYFVTRSGSVFITRRNHVSNSWRRTAWMTGVGSMQVRWWTVTGF